MIKLTEKEIRALIAKKLEENNIDDDGDLIISFPTEALNTDCQKKAYYQAHQVGNHILNLSTHKGKHDINVTLELVKKDLLTKSFVVKVKKDSILKLKTAQHNSLKKKRYSPITKWLALLIAPFRPKVYTNGNFIYKEAPFDFSLLSLTNDKEAPFDFSSLSLTNATEAKETFNINGSKMAVSTSKGVPLDVMKVHAAKDNSKKYVLHCHGNACIYPEVMIKT